MAKIITIKSGADSYQLEYTRATAAALQESGFDPEEIESKYLIMIPLLVHHAFLAHHPLVSEEKAMDIYAKTKNKTEFISRLIEMYADCITSLFEDSDDDEGNATWEVGW